MFLHARRRSQVRPSALIRTTASGVDGGCFTTEQADDFILLQGCVVLADELLLPYEVLNYQLDVAKLHLGAGADGEGVSADTPE